MAAAQQQATAGVAQATAEKQALSDPGTLSAGQKSYLGQGYDEQAAQYRTAYDVAAEQAAATKKQAYANIYDTLNKSVNATSKQYTEFMTALLNSSYGIAALQKVAGLNGVDTAGWFTTKGDEYRAANNLVGVDSSKFGAEKQALMDDKSLTWASATIAEDALDRLGVYDANSEIGKLARYYLTMSYMVAKVHGIKRGPKKSAANICRCLTPSVKTFSAIRKNRLQLRKSSAFKAKQLLKKKQLRRVCVMLVKVS